MVFQNKFRPYYGEANVSYKGVVDQMKLEMETIENDDEDGCDGIISRVFTVYDKNQHDCELIVRPAEIFARYDSHEDSDKQKLKFAIKKYAKLFEFYDNLIENELTNANSSMEQRLKLKKLNETVNELPIIKESKLQLNQIKNISLTDRITIVKSQVPHLSQISLFQQLENSNSEVKNAYISIKIFKNNEWITDLKSILIDESLKDFNERLKVIVSCKQLPDNELAYKLRDFLEEFKLIKFIFITSSSDADELKNKLDIESNIVEMHHKFGDLTRTSQTTLLNNAVVDFQNHQKIRISHLVEFQNDDDELMIDNVLLNLIFSNADISINSNQKKSINFNALFQMRKFIKSTIRKVEQEVVEETTEIDADEQLQDIQNDTFVLISDDAGAGKSWILKDRRQKLIEKYPDYWTTLVILRDFIQEFQSPRNKFLKFDEFMMDVILKSYSHYERKMFKNFYERGKVFVLFDAFDEISPNCAEFVKDLIKKFESNDGNKLWITTRTFFEVDLKKDLNLNKTYALKPLDFDECVTFIAQYWTLNDEVGKQSDNDECDKIRDEAQARTLLNHYRKFITKTTGLPQLLQIIAQSFPADSKLSFKEGNGDATYWLHEQLIKERKKIWSSQRGKLRQILSLKEEFSFTKVHQFYAMKHFFPLENEFCGLTFNADELNMAEIIGCGILNSRNGKTTFLHETFAEYFAADFLAGIIKNNKWGQFDDFWKLFTDLLTKTQFSAEQLFNFYKLNDSIVAAIPKVLEIS